jgi:hypothetical protein
MNTSITQDMVLSRQRVERIEAAMMWTSELLAKAVQDQRKVHTLLSHTAGRREFTPQAERKI